MDGRKWGKWLKNMYGIKDVSKVGADSGVVIVDHQVCTGSVGVGGLC